MARTERFARWDLEAQEVGELPASTPVKVCWTVMLWSVQ